MPLSIVNRAGDDDKPKWDITYLLFHQGKLYSASDDGTIKAWSIDLLKLAEVEAHPCSVYCLAANEDTLFSCSSDGTIKLWQLNTLKAIKTLTETTEYEFWRIAFSNGCLFSGDDHGNINVYKDNKLYGQVNIAEPIKDMLVYGTLVFTVKDLDLVVTEIRIDGEKIQYGTKTSFMGRAPVALIGEKLFAFITREGTEIQLHKNCIQSGFKQRGSDLIINAMAGTIWNDSEQLFSGGWDKTLKRWLIDKNFPILESVLNMDVVIHAITTGESNQVFVGGADGHIIRVDTV